MALPKFTIRDLLEAGVHFGHKTNRWNPKMAPFIHGQRNGIHILDLTQTVPALYNALSTVKSVSAKGGKVLFVGSKPQAEKLIQETAERTGQFFINSRWLGGTMTNWRTITTSIRRLKSLEKIFADEANSHYTKKELLKLRVEYSKLHKSLGGIQDMGGLPDVVVVIDAVRENIAIAEAKKLGIPVVAVLDSNADPEGIDLPVPGNDDSTRAIRLYLDLVAQAIAMGKSAQVVKKTTKAAPAKKAAAKVSLSPKAKAEASKEEAKA